MAYSNDSYRFVLKWGIANYTFRDIHPRLALEPYQKMKSAPKSAYNKLLYIGQREEGGGLLPLGSIHP